MARNNKTTKVDLAREYRTKYGMDMPTLKLARIMYKENSLLFSNLDEARTKLRYIEGKSGKANAASANRQDHKFVLNESRPKNPYHLPKSDEDVYKPFFIKGHKRGLILNDIHLPYHSVPALNAAIEFGLSYKPDFIFLNGDVCDFHQLSYFMKDPRKKRFSEELDMLQEFIENLYKLFKCKIYYKFGNHEERYDSFLFQKAHELVGVEDFALEAIIKKRVPDVEIIRDKRIVVIAGLPIIHGHEFGRGLFNPVNAARGLFLQAKRSCVKGDCHTTSKHVEKDVFGKIMITHSVGCLCGLSPKWLPLNKWNNGFATIDITGANSYQFKNYEIINGEIV